MSDADVLLSELAAKQLEDLPAGVGKPLLAAIARLIAFPESGTRLRLEGYEPYRQVIVKNHRAIYKFFPKERMVRVYCIIHTRRQYPPLVVLSDRFF